MHEAPSRDTPPATERRTESPAPPARSRLGSALWNYLGGAGSAVLVTIQSLVLIPIYLDQLGMRLYGAWLGSGEILVWLLALDLGLPNLITQRVAAAHSDGDQERVDAWVYCGGLLLALVALTIAAAGIALAGGLPVFMGLQGDDARGLVDAFRLGCVATAISLFSNLFIGYSRGVQRTFFLNGVSILAVAANFATSLALILAGYGLMAIAYGMLARAVVMLAGGALFVAAEDPRPRLVPGPLLRGTLTEALRMAPITTLGAISFAVTTRCELFVVATLGAPEMASAYMVVRKGAELGRTFMSILSFACYAPFAHLVATRDWARIRNTYASLRSLQSSIAVALLGAYVLLNASFVDVWVGAGYETDLLLTVLIALQTYIYAEALLANYLYRATGRVAEGAKAMSAEALCRVVLLIVVFAASRTLIVVPAVGAVTSAGLALFGGRRLAQFIASGSNESIPPRPLKLTIVRLTLGILATALAMTVDRPDWLFIVAAGAAWAGASGLLQIGLDRDAWLGVRGPLRLLIPRARP
jgi:O-antigen/teichoic acid export membrane protein